MRDKSKTKTILASALIILANDNIPSQILESGVILDANISSQLIDQFGFFGMPVQKFNVKQIPGYVLLAAGVALVVTG